MRLTWYACGCTIIRGRTCELVAPLRCDVHRCERTGTEERTEGALVLDARLGRYLWLPASAWDALPATPGRAFDAADRRGELVLFGRIVDEHLVAPDLGRVAGAIGRPQGGREQLGEVRTR